MSSHPSALLLKPLKSLIVIDIVDNEVGDGSSPCVCMTPIPGVRRTSNLLDTRLCTYTQENAFHVQQQQQKHRRQQELPIGDMCQGAHGFSLLLIAEYEVTESNKTKDDNDEGETTINEDEEEKETSPIRRYEYLLFDTGPNPELWKHNTQRLHVPLHKIDTVVLSHYHIDHSGGLRSAIPEIIKAKQLNVQQDTDHGGTQGHHVKDVFLTVDLHSDYIATRGIKLRGTIHPMTPTNPSSSELQQLVQDLLVEDDEKQQIHITQSKTDHVMGNGCFYVSGEIPRLTSFETGLSGHFRQVHGGHWSPDPDILDERYVACLLEGRGIVLFSACSHAGIINICHDARTKLKCDTLSGIVGGLHLAGSSVEERIDETVRILKDDIQPGIILAGHCTGWKAKAKLATNFQTNYQPLCTGGMYHFKSLSTRSNDCDIVTCTALCPLAS